LLGVGGGECIGEVGEDGLAEAEECVGGELGVFPDVVVPEVGEQDLCGPWGCLGDPGLGEDGGGDQALLLVI